MSNVVRLFATHLDLQSSEYCFHLWLFAWVETHLYQDWDRPAHRSTAMVEPKIAEFWNPSASWSVLQSVSSLTLFRQCSHFDMLQVHGFPHNHPKDCWLISTCEIPVTLVPTCPKWFLSPFGFINGLLPPFLDRPQFLLVKQLHFAGCKFLSMWPPGPVTWTSSRNFLSKAPCWDGTWWGLNQNWETPHPQCHQTAWEILENGGFNGFCCQKNVDFPASHVADGFLNV